MIKIALVNDILTGTMGEKVLWDYLLEEIPNLIKVDDSVVGNLTYKQYIDNNIPDCEIILQNASFIPLVDPDRYTISYLQDNLRAMGLTGTNQDYTLSKSDIVVSNSHHTAKSYSEYDIKIIPIGVDDQLFKPIVREKNKRPKGIFVGALNEVKGWKNILKIITKRTDIDWIIVTKNQDNYQQLQNDLNHVEFYMRVSQRKLSEFLNESDFFILGSPVETQCLSAIEACMVNLPIIMNNTGIFADFDQEDKNLCGIFDNNMEKNIDFVLKNIDFYTPRNIMLKHNLDINGMLNKWKKLLGELE